MNYRELQQALKKYRDAGEQLSCRLNECKETLANELKRIEDKHMQPEVRTARALLDVGIDVYEALDTTWTITIQLVFLAYCGWLKAGISTVQLGRKARELYDKHKVEEKVKTAVDDTVDCVYALFYVSHFAAVTVKEQHYRGCEWIAGRCAGVLERADRQGAK